MKVEVSASGSGSISQRHGSADPDPDPHQNVMDPQHWCLISKKPFFSILKKDTGEKSWIRKPVLQIFGSLSKRYGSGTLRNLELSAYLICAGSARWSQSWATWWTSPSSPSERTTSASFPVRRFPISTQFFHIQFTIWFLWGFGLTDFLYFANDGLDTTLCCAVKRSLVTEHVYIQSVFHLP